MTARLTARLNVLKIRQVAKNNSTNCLSETRLPISSLAKKEIPCSEILLNDS